MIWDPTKLTLLGLLQAIVPVGKCPRKTWHLTTKPYTKAAKQHTPEACVACHSRAQGRPGKCFQPAVRKVVEFAATFICACLRTCLGYPWISTNSHFNKENCHNHPLGTGDILFSDKPMWIGITKMSRKNYL